MTITYDAEGKCTRCGSTGYTPERVYDVTGEATDVRRVVPCECHGWRPIEFAPQGVFLDVWRPGYVVLVRASGDTQGFTHFRPRPQPPEVGT